MRVFSRSVGMMVIGPMPERASTKADQNVSRVLPIGVTTPIPVMTTRIHFDAFAATSFSTISATSPTVANGNSELPLLS